MFSMCTSLETSLDFREYGFSVSINVIMTRRRRRKTIRTSHLCHLRSHQASVSSTRGVERKTLIQSRVALSTVQARYMGETKKTAARGRGTGTCYNHNGTSGILEFVGKHKKMESSFDSISDEDD